MPPKKGKKGGRRGDDSDEEPPVKQTQQQQGAKAEGEGAASKREALKAKREARKGSQQQQRRGGGDSDSDDDFLANMLKKKGKLDSDDDEEDEAPVARGRKSPVGGGGKKGKPQQQKGGNKFLADDDDDDDDDEEEAPKAPAGAKGGKKGGKGGAAANGRSRFAVDSDDDEDEEQEEEEAAPVSQAPRVVNLMDEDDDDDRRGKKKKGGKKGGQQQQQQQQGGGKKKKGGARDDDEEEEEQQEQPKEAAAPRVVNLMDEDDDDDRRRKKKGGKKQQQQGGKGGGKRQQQEEDEEEEELAALEKPKTGLFAHAQEAGGKGKKEAEKPKTPVQQEEEEEEEEEPSPAPSPVPTKAPVSPPTPPAEEEEDEDDEKEKKKKKKKKKEKEELSDSEEEGEKKKKKKKDKKEEKKEKKEKKKDKKKKSREEDEDEEEEDESGSGGDRTPRSSLTDVTDRMAKVAISPKAAAPAPTRLPTPPPTSTSPVPPPEPPAAAKPAAPAKKKVDKFAAKLAARAEEALKKQAEDEAKLAALKAQVEAEEAEKAKREAEERAKAQAERAANGEEDDEDDESDDSDDKEEGAGDGAKPAEEDSRFLHDEGWVEDFGGDKGLAGMITELKAKLEDPNLSGKAKKKLQKELEAKQRQEEYEKAAIKSSLEGAQFSCSQSAVNESDPQWQNALDIKVPDFSISAHRKELFHNSSLNIAHGRRYGFVGPNGQGKTTLLKMIASGNLKIPPRIDVLYVEQEVVADNTPAVEAVMRADKERWALLEEEKALLKQLDEEPDEVKDARLAEVYEAMSSIGADRAEAKARRILFGLGFDDDMQVKPTKNFSGGWRMRISLARALFLEPTLLMLDEPTNHLDLNAVIWLDDYLQKWKKTLLVVSHDQDFLNSVCDEILHLDNKKIVQYKGNYDDFKEMEEQKRKNQQKAWEKQEKMIKQLKSGGTSKAKAEQMAKSKGREAGGAKKKKGDAVATGQEAMSVKELIERPREYTVQFSFPPVSQLTPPVLQVSDVSFRYGRNPWIFEGLSFGIDLESRICIVGANGSGKTTLLKLMTGALKPTEGEIRFNSKLKMGIYNQHFVDILPMEKTPVEHLRDQFQDQDYQSIRNRLGRYGLQGHAHEIPLRDLSGGQKARVVFVQLSLMAPHILFLDEPTNNLDIETIDALCDAINEFNGGVVLVSHDARLIESTECRLWIVGEERNVREFGGAFDEYKKELLQQMEEHMAAQEEKKEAAAAARRERLAARTAGRK